MTNECPRIIGSVPVYTAMTPMPLMYFLSLSQETGRADAQGRYKLRWIVGGPKTQTHIIRNAACAVVLQSGATHLLLIDDDMCPTADIIDNLLLLDLPIVSPIFFRDNGDPLVFDWDPVTPKRVSMTNYPVDQVFEAPAGVGTGVMLIKRQVIEAIDGPCFGVGEYSDLDFCAKAAAVGFKSYCDSRILVRQMGKPEPIGSSQWERRRQCDEKK